MANYVEMAYAAGIVDGEGYIGIIEDRNARSVSAVVTVCMTDAEVPVFLEDTFGGNVYHYPPAVNGRRDRFMWQICGQKAANFLTLIEPYLKIKQGQCQLLISYRNDPRLDHSAYHGRGHPLTFEEASIRSEYVQQSKALNQRGESN